MLPLLISGALIGLIVVLVGNRQFPGWGPVMLCAVSVWFPSAMVQLIKGPEYWWLGLILGSLAGAFAVSFFADLDLKKSTICISIYLGIQFALGFLGIF